ncbi:MAG: winged helix-turn-helix domain-containing protein [Bryobacteraceae bacterium]
MSELDRVIHEPARLTIVALLSRVKEADFLYLLRETGLTKGNLSTHLFRLEEAGYVEIEKTFRGKIPLTIVRLTSEGRAAFEDYRKSMKDILTPSKALSKARRVPVQLPT